MERDAYVVRSLACERDDSLVRSSGSHRSTFFCHTVSILAKYMPCYWLVSLVQQKEIDGSASFFDFFRVFVAPQ